RDEQAMQSGDEHGALDRKLEPALLQQTIEDRANPQPLPDPPEQQGSADPLGGDRQRAFGVLVERMNQQHLIGELGARGDERSERAGGGQLVGAAEIGDHLLADSGAVAPVLDDLHVAALAGLLEAEEHGRSPRAPRNPSRRQRSSAKIAQTWHYTLRKQTTGLNDINALRAQGPVYCSSRVIEGLRLRERNNVNITTPVHKGNLSEVGRIAEYARNNGVDYNFTSLSGRAWEGGQYPKLSIAPTGGLCRPNVLLDWLFIDFDGLVLPCCFDFSRSLPLGDLNHQTIEEMFSSPTWQSMFDTFKRGDWSSKGACSRCRADDAGEIVRLVDGLTSDVKSSLRRFPANSFRSAASTRRNPDGGIVADPEAPDSVLVYGPYVRAQPGRYRVYHDLRVLTASATCAIELDVCVGYRKTIARKRIGVSKENDFEAMIDFENTDDDVLEFRVHKSGNVSFEYKGARLLRL